MLGTCDSIMLGTTEGDSLGACVGAFMQRLLASLLIPGHAGMSGSAVLVDGFPRTRMQVDLVKLLHEKLLVRPHSPLATPLCSVGDKLRPRVLVTSLTTNRASPRPFDECRSYTPSMGRGFRGRASKR